MKRTKMENKGKVATAAAVLSMASTSVSLINSAKERYEDRIYYRATVAPDAFVYDEIMDFLVNNTYSGRRFLLRSYHSGPQRYYDDHHAARVRIKGYDFKFELEKPNNNKIIYEDEVIKNRLVFRSLQKGAVEALEAFISDLTKERLKKQRTPNIWTVDSRNGWDSRSFHPRQIDSIILAEGLMESLRDDLDTFLNSEKAYDRLGVPYHRGYLFYGPPGNGKSSLVKAVASHYALNLYNLPLSAVKDDRELMGRVNQVQPNSVLLLEDIDIFSKSMSREQSDSGPTLAGLLNALDGVSTPHGLLTFMSTNRLDVLDPALVRPGRIDRKFELLAPTRSQTLRMFEYAFGEPLGVEPREFTSMAELSGVFKVFPLDAEACRLEIKG